jgi:hypothetical protein
VGLQGTPQNGSEHIDCRTTSAIRVVATSPALILDDAPTANAPPSEAPEVSFDKTVQITRVGIDDSGSVTSEESDGPLDYGPSAPITEYHDISMGFWYDEQLIDHINANWDEELTSTQIIGTWPTVNSSTELLYEGEALTQDTVQFYDAVENPQSKDMPTTERL